VIASLAFAANDNDPGDTLPPDPAEDTWPPEEPRLTWDASAPSPTIPQHSCLGPCHCPVTRAEFERKTAGWLT
jgi:hypothetical protein